MGYVKKIWKDRKSEYPNRRTLTMEDGSVKQATVSRDEGAVSEEGDAFNAENMNDLETRVAEALTTIRDAFSIDGTVVTINFDKIKEVI